MKKTLSILLCLILLASVCACGSSGGKDDGEKTYKIGVIILTDHPALQAACDGFLAGMDELGIKYEADIQNAQGEQTVCATIATKFVNDGVDLIFAIATPAAQAVAQATDTIPVLVTAVTDPESAGLVNTNEMPGTNVSGTSDMNPIEEQTTLLMKLVPDAKTIGILYCSSEDNSILQEKLAREALEAKGFEVLDFTVADSGEVQSVTQSMVGKVDAVYIPTDNVIASSMSAVSVILNQAGIPTVVGEANMVENGGTATYGINYYNLGKQTAIMAKQVLVEGADISTMPIQYSPEEDLELTLNQEAMDAMNLTLDLE
ncbi:MAG: ABC transporter substrate-binding protein [Eubacteriaceae bacterium]|nr:ABC transporter substrate-binding protein [Eubacteriaceae bacterium]